MGNVSFGDAAGMGRFAKHRIGQSAAKMIKHRLDHNYGLAADIMRTVERAYGDSGLFYLAGCLGFVGIPAEVRRKGHAGVPEVAYETEEGELELASVDEVPPFIRAHLRMLTCLANRDGEMALCIWETMPPEDKRSMIRAYTDMAATGFARHTERPM
jgi:hypothetical protein